MADGANRPLADGGELSHSAGLALLSGLDQPEQQTETNSQPVTPQPEAGAAEAESEPVETGEDGAADTDQPPADDAADETDAAAEEQPPIDPPRSWTKADKDAFAALPRETQQRIAERETAREAEFRRSQNEAANQARANQAQLQAAEQARQQYEQAVNWYAEQAQAQAQQAQELLAPYADIRTWEDRQALAVNDPLRFSQYLAASQEVERRTAALNQAYAEQQRVEGQRQQEASQRFNSYKQEQLQRFLEKAPEFADAKTAPQLQADVRNMLVNDFDVSPEELQNLWNGASLSIHDHRVQLLIRDALMYRKAKANVAKRPLPANKPVQPLPVQKPGPATPRTEGVNGRIKQMDNSLTRTGKRDIGLELIMARRAGKG